jgi:hypothetical protein
LSRKFSTKLTALQIPEANQIPLNRSCSSASDLSAGVYGAGLAEDMGMVKEDSSDGRRE